LNGRCCVFSRRAQEQFDEEEARRIKRKSPKTNLVLMISTQIQQVKKMGNMKDLVGMIPGASKAMKDVEIEDDAFKHIEAIIHSMTFRAK
jgi:signal recognition particle subunit SRP54